VRSRSIRPAVAAMAIATAVLLGVVAANSVGWIGRTFPGFLVMRNRVVASVTLRDWLPIDAAVVFQHQVVAVGGMPTSTSDAVYGYVQRQPPGTALRYTLRTPEGALETVEVPSRRFSGWDYARLFAAYLLTGVTFLASGLLVFLLLPSSAGARGLLSCGLAIGIFAITGVDLYGPHWFFRLHVAAEAMSAAALLHLAVVFPVDRVRERRGLLLLLYAPFVLLALVYQAALSVPSWYTTVHLVAVGAQGLAALATVAAVVLAFVTSGSPLVRRRIGVVVLGTLGGFLIPGLLSVGSGLVGGSVPVNFAALTVFLFPLSLAYAVLKRDLFEIDTVLRHAVGYILVAAGMGAVYVVAILLAGTLLPSRELVANAPVVLALLNLVLLFLVVPIRARTQRAIDRLFFRQTYDAHGALSDLGRALAAVQGLDGVASATRRTLSETLCPVGVALLLDDGGGCLRRQGDAGDGPVEIRLPAGLADRAAAGEILARYEWDDGSGREMPAVWSALDADLIVPIHDARGLAGILALGRRRSGRIYTAEDVGFLRTLANQVALGIEDVRLLEKLEHKQASLIRADRLATLGRLASGLAHEMGSPLGAIMNALRVLVELGREYESSIDEPTVLPEDHRQIASEIVTTALKGTEWAEKASAFLKRINMHAREPHSGAGQHFAIGTVVAETRALLAHRLRKASCRLDLEEELAGLTLRGDPALLGQVLANLVGNAIDAYEDRASADGASADRRLLIQVRREGRAILLSVRDWAGGMPEDVFTRIFDELYTTKDPGRGTGLGLWISRNLIEQGFAGTLVAETVHGVGTCFVATFPLPEDDAASAPPAASSDVPAPAAPADRSEGAPGTARAA